MRSADLSRMARNSAKLMNRYPCGLDDELISQQSKNKQVIPSFFGITDLEWNDWRWHTRNIIRDAATMGQLVSLSPEEAGAITRAKQNRIPFGVTPYYVSLMDQKNSNTGRPAEAGSRVRGTPSMSLRVIEGRGSPGSRS